MKGIHGNPTGAAPAARAFAYREIVARAHARGIRVVGGTTTSYGEKCG
ncbi:hypothetical protein [Streptomyces sp. NPDC001100]